MTNQEFVDDLIQFEHPMMQVFMLEAVSYYSNVITQPDEKAKFIKKHEDGFFSPEAWLHCAERFKKRYEARHKNPKLGIHANRNA